jgi:antitoxin MazE
MEVALIKIGNSKGIRLSKAILEKYNILDKIEMTLEEGYIILKPKLSPRKNWEKAFAQMHEEGDDELLMDNVFSDEQFEES